MSFFVILPILVLLPLLFSSVSSAAAEDAPEAKPPDPPGTIDFREGLAIDRVGRSGRTPLHSDAVEARLVSGDWTSPKPGDRIIAPDGSDRTWKPISAGDSGEFPGREMSGGYLLVTVASEPRIAILEASGHGMVYVNGEPRMGDPYGTGAVRLPVRLRDGTNEFLFQAPRGALRARLVPAEWPAFLNTADTTLPDLIAGEKVDAWGAVVVGNATDRPLSGWFLTARGAGLSTTRTPLPIVPPLSVRKAGFRIAGSALPKEGTIDLRLRLSRGAGAGPEEASVELRVRRPDQSRKITFHSEIDGSVQYYAVQPMTKGKTAPPALFLSLHGAGVEAIGQADAYAPKSWGHIVCPTNRRPYGFDWEEWGRLDAMEVLDLAMRRLGTDPRRTYLTGHSMGGHGAWHLGVTYPDRFAAVGPSAGWVSFFTYAGSRQREEGPLFRASNASDTPRLATNLAGSGVYILHGADDDNVPPSQAETMARRLAEFHPDFIRHEQPNAGHWWDLSEDPGADCVDWAPMFDLFSRRAIPTPESVREVDFVTANPGISATAHWLSIEAQMIPLEFSRAKVRYTPHNRRFTGETENVSRLSIDVSHLDPVEPIGVTLDGVAMDGVPYPKRERRLWLYRDEMGWAAGSEPSPSWKGPHRNGPFKDAFRHRVVFVYGTKGSEEENEWAFRKARYDAELFLVRGNGSVDVIPDDQFRPHRYRDRGVILYGNADTNGAWESLMEETPIEVRRGSARIGGREERGEDLACLFLRPRPDSNIASVGVVGGTGIAGMRLTDRLSYFTSGAGYPDYLLLGPEMLAGETNPKAVGYFESDWSL